MVAVLTLWTFICYPYVPYHFELCRDILYLFSYDFFSEYPEFSSALLTKKCIIFYMVFYLIYVKII